MKIFFLLFFLIEPTKNLRHNPPNIFALKNAKIIVNSQKTIEKGIIIIREGKIEEVGKNIKIPSDAYEIDLSGKWIYPGFIEPYFLYKEKKEEKKKDFYLSPKVHPEIDIPEIITFDENLIKKYRENGFTAALFIPGEGIFRGKSAVFSLKEGEKSENLIKKDVFEHIAFEYYKREKGYPNSLMGAIAVIRQIFYDVIWHKEIWEYYEKNKNISKPVFINSLYSLYPFLYKNHKVCFEIEDDIDIYRVLKIKKEFNLNVVIKGSSYEYRQIDILKKEKIPLIIPVNFPEKLDFETPEEAMDISLKELLHFEYAPWNPKKLWKNGIEFAFTTDGLKDIKIFFKNLKEAIKRGLPESYVLKALTENPAKILGIENLIGSIEKGKLAHFIVTDGNIFRDGKIYEVWIEDKIYKIKEEPLIKPEGKWEIVFYFPEGKKIAEIEIREDEKLKGEIIFENEKIPFKKIEINFKHLDILFDSEKLGHKGLTFISGIIENGIYKGRGILPCGKEFNFEGFFKGEIKKEEKIEKEEIYEEPKILYPPSEFGREFLPKEYKYILIKNARIWTCSNKGILEGYDILIKDGKFYKIGKNLKEKNAFIIDANGKNITPGIIDPHSHIGVKGEINETGDIITSEVRIEDVIDPYDISIYRLLAGGVTISNILHGSANAIGGQNCVIKHKWGVKNPDELIFKKGIPTLKFALGENPKYGEDEKFPQTRMGIKEIIEDKFKEAIDYKYQKMNFKYPLRKNLEIEPILEVVENKRMPYVHAYRADEMLTFLKLAKEFGIKKVSFQHALEGYKIIDKLKEFGAYATVFSDFWAYKFEAYDGIPYNAAMLYKNGIIVSLHSDFNEIARRLNTEAAKSIKYGGLSEEEALKLITIYPAIQLGIDKYTGSIEEGKDADFVIWDGNPLSTYSKVLETWIEGKKYFDREEDLKMRERDKKERFRIIQKYLKKKEEKK